MRVLITGGAGFIGCNLAADTVRAGHEVTLFDNLSRRGADANLRWLRDELGDGFRFVRGDVRDAEVVRAAAEGQEAIYHLAGQVAVTTSVVNPREDFEINAWGTFNVLEAARASGTSPIVIYASTNKVYGGMEDARVVQDADQYRFADLPLGVPETWPLDFHSPYGCSKGTGDQYARDYARIYGLPTVVFRQSCIYGQRQFGIEDQGWLAHFTISAALNRPVSIYGDGRQVRDVLHIDDLVRAFALATERIEATRGQVYNIGGGADNTLSVWAQTGPILERLSGRPVEVRYGDWRPGDQRIYVSDIRKAEAEFGWRPEIAPEAGLGKLWEWVESNRRLFG